MKKILVATVLAVGLASAGFVYAHSGGYGMMGGGHGMMGGGGYETMGPEMMGGAGGYDGEYGCPGAAGFGQNGWSSEKQQKFLTDTVQLRKEINDKRFEYREAQRNPQTTRDQIAALEKGMIDLRTKLSDKADQYRK
jgi:hypothetical protein